MKERSLVAFTILSQLAVGAFWTLGALYAWVGYEKGARVADELTGLGWAVISLVMVAGLLASFLHLGTPTRAWRALGNLRRSWLSREIFLATLFAGMSILFAIVQWSPLGPFTLRGLLGATTGLVGVGLIYAMASAYRLRTIPAWNTWVTPASFFITTFLLGALAAGMILIAPIFRSSEWTPLILRALAGWAIVLLGIQLVIFFLWIARLTNSEAAQSSALKITKKHRTLFILRLALAVGGMIVSGAMLLNSNEASLTLFISFALVLASEILGRTLFYQARVRYGV